MLGTRPRTSYAFTSSAVWLEPIFVVVGHGCEEINTKACVYIWQRQDSVVKELGAAGQWPVCPGNTERVEKVVYVSWPFNEKWTRYTSFQFYHRNAIKHQRPAVAEIIALKASFTASNHPR